MIHNGPIVAVIGQTGVSGRAEAAQGWKGAGPIIGCVAVLALIVALWARKWAKDS